MNYKISIVDDNITDTEYITSLVRRWADHNSHIVAVTTFPSAEAFLFAEKEAQNCDMILLDIEMGEMDGVELAKRIRARDETVQLIFITGYPDFIAEGYEVSALHYLMKPVPSDKLFSVLSRAAGNIKKAEKCLHVVYDRQTDVVPLSRILYIEAQRQYVVIHTNDKIYRMKSSLVDTEDKLDEYFFKCQRSFLVNLRYVVRIKNDCVVLKNDIEIPISRGMAEKIGREIIRLFP